MPESNMLPAFLEAFHVNEIGSKSPFEILFAAKGQSGGSFGAMQGDLAAGQKNVTKTFRDCLAAAGVPKAKIDSLIAKRTRCQALPAPRSIAIVPLPPRFAAIKTKRKRRDRHDHPRRARHAAAHAVAERSRGSRAIRSGRRAIS